MAFSKSMEIGELFLEGLSSSLDHLVPRGSVVLIAVSGGPDSLALLEGWMRLAPARGDVLHVAHFDHALREDSNADAKFVAAVAENLSVPFHHERAMCSLRQEAKGSLEAAARDARYQFLAKQAHAVGASVVATGHTADDQVETVLFSILRGTGLHGLAGMPQRRSLDGGMELVRPLLGLRRREILSFLEKIGRNYLTDPTNQSVEHARNRVRWELLPMLREAWNPRVDESLLRLSELADRTSRLLTSLADQLLTRATVDSGDAFLLLDASVLRREDPLLVAEMYRRVFEKYSLPRARLGHDELRRLAGLHEEDSPRAWDLADGVRAEKRLGKKDGIRVTWRPLSEGLVGDACRDE
ncbi:MAG: tRNA lysidine(34) synthetase TilS [Planctomycetota bacterium]